MLDRPLPISTVSAKLANATSDELLEGLTSQAARRVSAEPQLRDVIGTLLSTVYRGTLALAGDADPYDIESDAEALHDMGKAIDALSVAVADRHSLPNPQHCGGVADMIGDDLVAKLHALADQLKADSPASVQRAIYASEYRADVAREEGAR